MRVLLVIDSLRYRGAARQLTLLAPELDGKRVQSRICVLGGETPWTRRLAAVGANVTPLGWTRMLDGRALWRLRAIVREFQPDVVHALGQRAYRAVATAAKSTDLILSHGEVVTERRSALPAVDRWLLGRAKSVVASSAAEASAYRRLGVGDRRVVLIPPGVKPVAASTTASPTVRESLGLSPGARLVACVGPLEFEKGFKDAVWAFDILKYVYDDLYLLLIGDGPARLDLQRFTRAIRADDRVRWLGDRSAVPELLAQVDILWVPSHADRGRNAALEAMSAGRPVVASRLPGLAEIVVDGRTGFLVGRGDKAAFARRTHFLLKEEQMRGQLGEAGRKRARRSFSVNRLVNEFTRLYEEAA